MSTTYEPRQHASGHDGVAAHGAGDTQHLVPESGHGRVGRGTVIVAVVTFASWTCCYQIALALGISALPTLAGAAALSAVLLALLWTGRRGIGQARPGPSPLPGGTAVVAAVIATAAALALSVTNHRAWALIVGGATAAVSLVFMAKSSGNDVHAQRASTHPAPPSSHPVSRWLWPLGWLAAVASAYGATRISRSDGDDAYFINLSTWVADRGSFPVSDTMISQDGFTPNLGHSPPTHSVEALIGALSRLTGVEAGSIAYLAVPPLLTLLGVLILTWAVHEARIPTAPAALLAAVGYLWTTGATGYSFGGFFAARLWQGKAMLVSLAIPLLFILGSRLLRRGGWRNHLLFGSAVVASVGFSNTSAFLVPMLLVAMFVAGLVLRQPSGAFRVIVWSVYPLASGVVSYVMAPPSPTTAQLAAEGFPPASDSPLNPLSTVPGKDGLLVATVLAIGLGVLGLANRTMRAVVVSGVVVAAIALLPPVRDVFAAVGLGGVVWRMWWLIPVPLLIGGVVGAVSGRLPRYRAFVALPLAVLLLLLPLVGGRWVGEETSKTRIVSSTTWKVPRGALAVAQYAEQISRPNETVLLPHAASSAMAALTVLVQPVSARVLYQASYSNDPEAHAGARRDLQTFIDKRTPEDVRSLDDELDLLDVRTACVRTTREGAIELLQGAGYSIVGTVRNLTCLRR